MNNYKYHDQAQSSYDTDGFCVVDSEGNEEEGVIRLSDALAICEAADEEIAKLQEIIETKRAAQERTIDIVQIAIDDLRSVPGLFDD